LAPRELGGQFTLSTGQFQPNEQRKMKTLIRSINRSPLRCGFFTLAIALCWFALSPPLKAQCPSECGAQGGNTAVGNNALDSLTTGINNTAVGKDALTNNTDGAYNVAIGRSALDANVSGNFNMAIGTEALQQNNANFNLAIGFRTLFQNTTGNHLTGIGAAALRNNTTASDNTAIGSDALRENTTGEQNTAIGSAALAANTTVNGNTAVGFQALTASQTSFGNVAIGNSALESFIGAGTTDTNGFNTAVGSFALRAETTGQENTAVGRRALQSLLTGSNNTAIGWRACDNYTGDESGNILIGSDVSGTAGEDNFIRIGSNLPSDGIVIGANPGVSAMSIGTGLLSQGITILQTLFGSTMQIGRGLPTVGSSTYIGGIVGFAQPTAGTVFDVSIETNAGSGNFQRLGIDTSSRRFKEDIKPMDKASEAIFKLKPVTYRIKKESNPAQPLAYGLIAEDVAEACPALAAYMDGQPMGVHYKEMSVMLLNEFLKEHKKVEEQQASIAELKSTVASQQKEMQVLTAQLKQQAAQIQKVSAQLEASKPAPKVVANQ
jgi:trimeric autotransporter adhesin